MLAEERAMVVLSGGQDSVTSMFWALDKFEEVHAVTFNYNQRHRIEIEAAIKTAKMARVKTHEVIDLGPILKGTSPLVSDEPVGHYPSSDKLPGGIEPTFVPCRNILFLTIAANRAVCAGAGNLVTGLCEEDYGGYPDCRASFVRSMQETLNEGIFGIGDDTRDALVIQTPLMKLTKAQTVNMAAMNPRCWEALAYSHTCYDGQYPPNPHNHASILRARGFHEAGKPDPLIMRAKREQLLPENYPEDGFTEGTPYAMKG